MKYVNGTGILLAFQGQFWKISKKNIHRKKFQKYPQKACKFNSEASIQEKKPGVDIYIA